MVAFDESVFVDDTNFREVDFGGDASFAQVEFEGKVQFSLVSGFRGEALFREARFGGEASFAELEFHGKVSFEGAGFSGAARFQSARFHESVTFERGRFGGFAVFKGARFHAPVSFESADFVAAELLGPAEGIMMTFAHATFRKRMVIDVVAAEVYCGEANFEAGVDLRTMKANVDLTRAAFGKPSTIAGRGLSSLRSIREVDAVDLVLTDLDLSSCTFAGAHHLDKLRLEGECRFLVRRRRQVLAEDPRFGPGTGSQVGPQRMADLYRQLRKAQEDSKNEPGAADFYYGEMEMRRHSPATPWSERVILHLYWLVSGYGLRALRALATLAVLIAVVSVSIWLGGFKTTPAFGDTLIYVAQSTVSLETKLSSLPKDLTPFGEVMRLVMRVLGPLLLGLTLLAVRNRVKR
nr:pentapeptide repeat-containing protein [Amycolatopsis oliviviridis]